MRTGRRLDRAGLTLVEFLFAVSVTAFAGLGVAGMFPAAFRSVVVGGQVTKATILAQEMADMMRADAFDRLGKSFASPDWGYSGFNTRTSSLPNLLCPPRPDDPNPDYKKQYNHRKWACDLTASTAQSTGRGLSEGYGTVAVACVNADGTTNTASPCPTDLRRVTVTVTWDRQGSRTVSLVTYVARTE